MKRICFVSFLFLSYKKMLLSYSKVNKNCLAILAKLAAGPTYFISRKHVDFVPTKITYRSAVVNIQSGNVR